MERGWRRLLVVTLTAICLYAGFSIYADVRAVGDRIGACATSAVGGALALALANYVLRFVRWQRYLRLAGAEAPMRTSALVFIAGFAMSVTPGKLGELLKAVLLHDAASVPPVRTAPVVVAERVTDLVALVLLGLVGVAAYGVATPMVVAAGVLVAAGLLVLARPALAHPVLRRLGRFASAATELYDRLTTLVRPVPLAWATLLGILAWLCECIGFALIVRGFPGAHVSLGLATLIYAATTLAGAFSFLPGGLVVTEAAMTVLLLGSAQGMDRATAVAATIVTRLCTLWFAVALGLVALGALRAARRARPP